MTDRPDLTKLGWLRPPSVVHPGWRCRWDGIKSLLTEEQDSAAVARVACALQLERLRLRSCGGRWADDAEVEQVSDEFHTIGFVDGAENADLDYFNRVLDGLYDWADAERVLIS